MAIIIMAHSTANTNGATRTEASKFQLQMSQSCCIQVTRVQNHWFHLRKGVLSRLQRQFHWLTEWSWKRTAHLMGV